MSKILIIKNNNLAEDVLRNLAIKETIELVNFLSIDELPTKFDKEIYHSLLLLLSKVTSEMLEFVNKLREEDNHQNIYIIGPVPAKDIYAKLQSILNCSFYERSDFYEDQLLYLTNQIAQKYDAYSGAASEQIKYQKFYQDAPIPIIIIDEKGLIFDVNDHFCSEFNYSRHFIKNNSISSFIPGFTNDYIDRFVFDENPRKEIVTNLIDFSGKFIPIELNLVKLKENQFAAFIHNKKDQLSAKRLLEYHTGVIELLEELFESVFNLNQSSDTHSGILKKLLNCETVIHVKTIKKNRKSELDIEHLDDETKLILKSFSSLIESVINNPEIQFLNFSEDNPAHIGYLKHGKTLALVPVFIAGELTYLTIAIFINFFKPTQFIYSILKIYSKTLVFKHTVLKMAQNISNDFKDLVENAIDGIYRSSEDGKIVYANPAFIRMFGYSSLEEILKLKIDQDFYRDKMDRISFVNELKSKNVVKNYISNLKRKSGDNITVLEQAKFFQKENGERYIEGFIRDITANKELEEKLQNSRIFTNEMIEQANIIITALDQDEKCIVWNSKAVKDLGYSKDEIINKENFFELLYPDEQYRKYVRQQFHEYFFNNKTNLEFKSKDKNNTEKIINWTAMRINSYNYGTVVVYFGIDLTETRQLQKRLLESQQIETYSSIAEIIATKFDDVVTNIKKDLGQVEQNEMDFNIFLEKSYARIRESQQFANQIYNLSNEEVSENQETIDINQAIENSVNILQQTLPTNINIKYVFNTVGQAQIATVTLHQIILNLALNSYAAMPNGGSIKIITDQVSSAENDFLKNNNAIFNKYFRISFSDSGLGMDKVTQKRMFEPFFTASGMKSSKGLGATLVYNMVKSINGFIRVNSQKDIGTTIEIFLPVNTEQTDLFLTSDSKEKFKILVVDDEEVIRELTKDICTTLGYETLLAEDGQEGIEIFKKNKNEIKLVLIDIIMPNLDGRELFYLIKEIDPKMKMIAASGYIDPIIRKELEENGIDGFLDKPFNIKDVASQIRRILKN